MTLLPDTAPALVVTAHGGPEVLSVREEAVSLPGPGELLVHVAAAGLNFIDVYQREGVYEVPVPFVAGNEGAGEVVRVGEGVTEVVVGDRVAWAMALGSFSRYAVVPAAAVVPVPSDLDTGRAAAVTLQGMTAHFLTSSAYPVQRGTVALVHAAAGGVGALLVQMLKAAGARVVATAGSPEKCETARARGADVALDTSSVSDLAAAVREATGGRGVDVAYDGVGQATFDASLASLRPRGLLVLFGAASGQVPPLDLQRLNRGGSLFVTRPTLSDYIATPAELRGRAEEVFLAVANGSLHVEVAGRYPLEDAGTAYAALEGRRTRGKVLLVP
ncbi:MAG TPA: quinone oxidoreductase [Dermatophilaceae bacterium]|nr:quinone oxidoreductase [Dermatophilaceae bacterium]